MPTQYGKVTCDLFRSAFSGEVVFAVNTINGERYEGIAPKHCAKPVGDLSVDPTKGTLEVAVINNGGKSSSIRMPDGESIEVPTELISLLGT